jgi:hypothetical protein
LLFIRKLDRQTGSAYNNIQNSSNSDRYAAIYSPYLLSGGQNPRIYWSDWHLGVGAGEYIHTAPIIHVNSQGSLSKRKENLFTI